MVYRRLYHLYYHPNRSLWNPGWCKTAPRLSTDRQVLTIIKSRFPSATFLEADPRLWSLSTSACLLNSERVAAQWSRTRLPVCSPTPSRTGWLGWESFDSTRPLVSLCLSPPPHLFETTHINERTERTCAFNRLLAGQMPSILNPQLSIDTTAKLGWIWEKSPPA